MAEDFDNHRLIFDDDDDLQGAVAVRAVFDVDVEDPFEQPGPAHARRFCLGRGVIGWWLGGTLWRSGNDFTVKFSKAAEGEKSELLLSLLFGQVTKSPEPCNQRQCADHAGVRA